MIVPQFCVKIEIKSTIICLTWKVKFVVQLLCYVNVLVTITAQCLQFNIPFSYSRSSIRLKTPAGTYRASTRLEHCYRSLATHAAC